MENQQPQAMVTDKVPKILLEILIQGTENDKLKMKPTLESLQKQLDKSRSNKHKARVLFYIDNTKTEEERKEWLMEKANCKYYVFVPEGYEIPATFISDSLNRIKRLESALSSVRTNGIKIKPKPKDSIQYAEVVE